MRHQNSRKSESTILRYATLTRASITSVTGTIATASSSLLNSRTLK